MPLYDYICNACGRQDFDVFGKHDSEHKCPCGTVMERKIPMPSILPDIEPYVDHDMGHEPVYVSSRREKKRILKERKLVQIG